MTPTDLSKISAKLPLSKKTYFILDADLSDGVHPTVCEDIDVILESVRCWLEENRDVPGEIVKIGTREMRWWEVARLKEI